MRQGDRAQPLVTGSDETKHSNAWTFHGLLRTAYRCVGKADAFRGGIFDTKHGVDALAVVAALSTIAQDEAASQTLEAALASQRCRGLHIGRYHDATPRPCRFGDLCEKAFPHARFPLKDSITGKWRSVTLAEMRQIKGATWRSPTGSVELFGQVVTVHWLDPGPPENFVQLDILVAPCVVESTRASVTYKAAGQKYVARLLFFIIVL